MAIFVFVILLMIINIIYQVIEINTEYDERLIECKIEDDNIICSFNGLSLVTFYYQKVNTDDETLIFIRGKMLLQNKFVVILKFGILWLS